MASSHEVIDLTAEVIDLTSSGSEYYPSESEFEYDPFESESEEEEELETESGSGSGSESESGSESGSEGQIRQLPKRSRIAPDRYDALIVNSQYPSGGRNGYMSPCECDGYDRGYNGY